MNYPDLIQSIQNLHIEAKAQAAGAVNRQLVLRNWLIGAYIVEFEQNGQDRAEYGKALLKTLARDLQNQGVSGCGMRMLERMRLFYSTCPQLRDAISSSPMTKFTNTLELNQLQISSSTEIKSPADRPSPLPVNTILRLSWTHWIELLQIDDPWKRAFYENECLKGNWSVRQLQRQIGSLLYERTGLSTDKEAVIQAGRDQSPESPQSIESLIRDPYILEFTGLAEKPHYRESDLETALLDHLQSFLLELGAGFCSEARQKRITVGNEHDYIDLVFYHRKLRCHLLIDLKMREFRHQDAGQLNFYLNYWKDREMEPDDNPPVGLLLCTDREATKVQYATAGIDHDLFVSRYLVALPKPEELEALIDNDRAVFVEQGVYTCTT